MVQFLKIAGLKNLKTSSYKASTNLKYLMIFEEIRPFENYLVCGIIRSSQYQQFLFSPSVYLQLRKPKIIHHSLNLGGQLQ